MIRTAIAFGLMLTIDAAAVVAQAPPQPRPPQTFPMFLQGQYATLKRNFQGSAEKMPAEHFSFKPSPEVRSYGELFGHTMETQYFFCHAVKGGPDPVAGKKLEAITDKATVIQMVKEAFAYCDDAFAGLSTTNATEMVTLGTAPNERQAARANQLTMVIVHGNEHYGNVVTYMRMKGIVPPSSAP